MQPTEMRSLLHGYVEPLNVQLKVYALEEIIAEKLRAILQQTEKLQQRGWARSRARDYYDLWRIFNDYHKNLDLSAFPKLLKEKCAVRQVSYSGPKDFFETNMMGYIEKTWQQWLGPLLPQLPTFDAVMTGLRPQIESLLKE